MTATPNERPVRRGVFVAGMLLLPYVFFGILEGGLRLAGYGEDVPLFVEVAGFEDYLVPNPDIGRRYFSRSSVVPSPPHDVFLAEKPAGTFRIFVQGASTAAGFPYDHGGSFARMLQQRLVPTYPARRIEVVNTAMAAVSTYTLLDLAGEILAREPDAVLIYAGHNEYFGALGAGSTESVGPTRLLVNTYLAVDHLRLVQLLRATWVKASTVTPRAGAVQAEGETLMDDMARERSIPSGGALYRRGLEQYRANLTELLCRYEKAGVPVFIGTLASNERDQAPFVSGRAPGTDSVAWRRRFDEANRLAAAGDTAAALAAYDALIRLDTAAADAYYARARLRDAGASAAPAGRASSGRNTAARADYLAAKDHDGLRFRAPEAMNAIVREAAAACGATVVETQDALAAASPGGIIGRELLLEHLHPNVDGYFLLADAYYRALFESRLLGEGATPVPAARARREVLVTALDSALASLHVRRLLNNWPFQPAGVTSPDTITVATPVDALALEVLQGRRSWLEATAALGEVFEQSGNFQEALRVSLALIQEQPYRAQPYLLAANLLVKLNRPAAALPYYQAADEREPSIEARRMKGRLLLAGGRAPEAVASLERANLLSGDDPGVLYDLSVAYAATGRRAEARETAERLLRLDARHPGAQRLLARLDAEVP